MMQFAPTPDIFAKSLSGTINSQTFQKVHTRVLQNYKLKVEDFRIDFEDGMDIAVIRRKIIMPSKRHSNWPWNERKTLSPLLVLG